MFFQLPVIGMRLILGAFLAVSLVPAPSAQAAEPGLPGSGPALWHIENDSARGQVYLFGSIHMMKKGVIWMSPKIQQAFSASTELVLEADMNPAAAAEVQALVLQNGVYPQGESLQGSIAPDLFEQVRTLGGEAGLPAPTINRLRPWYAATVIGVSYIQSHGYEVELGVDSYFQELASTRGVRISGLETVREQMLALSGHAPDVQEAMLRDTVDQLANMNVLLEEMTDAWVSGDIRALNEKLLGPMREVPELYDVLLVRRNRNWLPEIQALLNQPGVHFVVVGTAHLIGEDGLVAMLRNRGLNVKRY